MVALAGSKRAINRRQSGSTASLLANLTTKVAWVGFHGGHLTFAAKRNGKWVLMRDNDECSAEFDSVTRPQFSSEGSLLRVGVCSKKKCYLLQEGAKAGPEFDEISRFTFSGERYAYFGKRDKKYLLVVDGKETGPPMEHFGIVEWTDDNKHIAVAMYDQRKWTWLVDGNPGPAFDAISMIDFSFDFQHYVYAGANSKMGFSKQQVRSTLVLDGKPTAEDYQGKGLAGGATLLVGGLEYMLGGVREFSADFHGVGDPVLGPDGTLVFAQRVAQDNVAVRYKDASGPPFEDVVSNVRFSADGKHFAYVAKKGGQFVEVRDLVPGSGFEGQAKTKPFAINPRSACGVSWLTLDDDGSLLAYEIYRGGESFRQGSTHRALRRVVINGQAGPEYDALSITPPKFSADEKHHIYTVHGAEGGRDRLVVDGVESKLYDDISDLDFRNRTTLEFVARDNKRILRVTVKVIPSSPT